MSLLQNIVILLLCNCFVSDGLVGIPDAGIWTFHTHQKNYLSIEIRKSLYKNGTVEVTVDCSVKSLQVEICWGLYKLACPDRFEATGDKDDKCDGIKSGQFKQEGQEIVPYTPGYSNSIGPDDNRCDKPLEDYSDTGIGEVLKLDNAIRLQKIKESNQKPAKPLPQAKLTDTSPETPAAQKIAGRRKREDANMTNTAIKTPEVVIKKIPTDSRHVIATAWEDGIYSFLFYIGVPDGEPKPDISVTIQIKNPSGYLSAIDWPMLPFYGVMCLVYILYGIIWLVMMMCNWRDLLRIQYWIGGVIVLGMLEKAVFFAEFESIEVSGKSVPGALLFAELVSCVKRSLARILIVIVSLGFGIVKPRLGPALHKVLGMGAIYFILAAIESFMRVLGHLQASNYYLIAIVPLSVFDAAVCWWIFSSLVATMRTLKLKRNVVKLTLYRHFTNTLIFAVLASVAFMIWSMYEHKLAECTKDWKELWVDDAIWHVLFSTILLVIIILWRPSSNNQRYAYSPLADGGDESEEPMINGAVEGMKLRKQNSQRDRDGKNTMEDDLKWVEDNIPASLAETAMTGLLDSDEEIMTSKMEYSKRE